MIWPLSLHSTAQQDDRRDELPTVLAGMSEVDQALNEGHGTSPACGSMPEAQADPNSGDALWHWTRCWRRCLTG